MVGETTILASFLVPYFILGCELRGQCNSGYQASQHQCYPLPHSPDKPRSFGTRNPSIPDTRIAGSSRELGQRTPPLEAPNSPRYSVEAPREWIDR